MCVCVCVSTAHPIHRNHYNYLLSCLPTIIIIRLIPIPLHLLLISNKLYIILIIPLIRYEVTT